QDSAIVLNFVEEILDHTFRQFSAIVAKQTANDERAVPALHFIELSAGYDVWMFEVKKPVFSDCGAFVGDGFTHLCGQMLDSNGTFRSNFFQGARNCGASGKIQSLLSFHLAVRISCAVCERAR